MQPPTCPHFPESGLCREGLWTFSGGCSRLGTAPLPLPPRLQPGQGPTGGWGPRDADHASGGRGQASGSRVPGSTPRTGMELRAHGECGHSRR